MSNVNCNRCGGGSRATLLLKQRSWSPGTERDEVWERRRAASRGRRGRSLTDDDLEELRGCIELGFRFDEVCGARRSRLAKTLPALDLYYAVNGRGARGCEEGCVCSARMSPSASVASSSDESLLSGPMSILSPGDTPETVKIRIKQWAQIVAWSVRNRN